MFNSVMIFSMSDGKLKDNFCIFCRMSFLIFIRSPPPCLFLSFLKDLENLLMKNWEPGKNWSSLLPVITNISTILFRIELTLRFEENNLLWCFFFCLHKSSKSFSGSWLELGLEFSKLIEIFLFEYSELEVGSIIDSSWGFLFWKNKSGEISRVKILCSFKRATSELASKMLLKILPVTNKILHQLDELHHYVNILRIYFHLKWNQYCKTHIHLLNMNLLPKF